MCATPYALVAVAASLAATLAADAGFAAKKLMPRWLMPLRFGLTGVAVLGLLASVPAALEAHDGEREREAHAARLRADAPATRQALRARDRALADATKKADAASAESRALAARLEAREAEFDRKEAELRMAAGARHAEAQVAEARCETLAAETKAAKAQAERFAAEAARARAETTADGDHQKALVAKSVKSDGGGDAEETLKRKESGATRREPSSALPDATDTSS
jgi:membrane protein involved in colicin uptake